MSTLALGHHMAVFFCAYHTWGQSEMSFGIYST
jgi:hypothetical protein